MLLPFPSLLLSVGGCPSDGFSHLGKIKIFIGIVRNVVFLSLGKP
jgi:hypothetical protein